MLFEFLCVGLANQVVEIDDDDESTLVSSKNKKTKKEDKRRFIPEWTKTFTWIKYNKEKDKVFCNIFCQAVTMEMSLPNSSRDTESLAAFVTNGFNGWKNAIDRFKGHEQSSVHLASVNSAVIEF